MARARAPLLSSTSRRHWWSRGHPTWSLLTRPSRTCAPRRCTGCTHFYDVKEAYIYQILTACIPAQRCSPELPFRFQATADICRTFLWNAWCKREPGDVDNDTLASRSAHCSAVIPCLQLFLRGIQYWHSLSQHGDTDAMIERNMELCAAALRRCFSSDLFFERLEAIVEAAPGAWKNFSTDVAAISLATSTVPKLKTLWDELKTMSDPLQVQHRQRQTHTQTHTHTQVRLSSLSLNVHCVRCQMPVRLTFANFDVTCYIRDAGVGVLRARLD